MVFAHPLPTQGGTMHTKAVYQGAKGLVRAGCAVLRFNFRGVGRMRESSPTATARRGDFTAALDFMAGRYPGVPLWAAGVSFGSWIALRPARDDRGSRAHRHRAAGARDGYDFANVARATKPKFFVQGETR